ncbi:MAG: DEAD/DEAH box helicase [Fimbriimonadales bacterium]
MPPNSAEVDLAQIILALKRTPYYANQISEQGVSEAREAAFEVPERRIDPAVLSSLASTGIHRFYSHQADAIDLAEAGKNVVVTSGTSSGKSLCYNVPVLNRLATEPPARALYLFPTKALARDQLGKLRQILVNGIEAETYDGDTPKAERPAIRSAAHILLTNPDMLHVGILPNHTAWGKFLRNLRFVALDEMHTYSGVFGAHVSLVLRRLFRLCELYGSKPQIIACSATIANPSELFASLVGTGAEIVDRDGSPRGKRYLLMWNPPEDDEGHRRSGNSETSQLLGTFAVHGVRTLAFARSRITAELILRYTREGLSLAGPRLAKQIESYRGGYTTAERRAIEQRLFNGELLGLSTTDAMELGVDVGTLDAVIMNGFPGSISSLRQQAGRAGRGKREALGVLVAKNDPLDQYYMRHPEVLLDGRAEAVRAQPSNPYILAEQLRCAAYERPISAAELMSYPENSLEVLEGLEGEGKLVRRSGMWLYPSPHSPAGDVDIRGGGGIPYTIQAARGEIGTMDQWRAFMSAHAGAIYLHRGDQYLVTDLNLIARQITVERVEVNYYTQSLAETTVTPKEEIDALSVNTLGVRLEAVEVTTSVDAFFRRSLLDDSVISREDLDLPPSTFDTFAVRFDVPTVRGLDSTSDGVHALEHLFLALAPTIAQCEVRDLGSAYYPLWPETARPAIFVFDAVAGGIGLAETLFTSCELWLERVTEQLFSCTCTDGCPACVLSARCPYANESIDKGDAARILLEINT